MATNRILQLLRSKTLYESLDAAKIAIRQINTASDGEVRLARYQASDGVKSLLCVYHTNENFKPALDGSQTNMPGWTFIEDASASQAVQNELDKLESQVGLDGTTTSYAPSVSGDAAQVLTGAQSSDTAPTNLKTAVENIATYVGGLDVDVNYTSFDDSKIINKVKQENGQVSANAEELSSVKLASVTGTNAAIAAEDTLGTALGKLQAQIDAMDSTVSTAVNNGDVITSISETNGVVTADKANLTDVLMTGYSKDTDATGAIAATDSVGDAFSKLENAIAAGNVHSNDHSIAVDADSTNGGTNIEVNVDGRTIVKDGTTGTLSADLEVVQLTATEISALNNANVKEAYKLIYATDTNRTAIGDVVKIYKDSALQLVYLGTANDTIDASTGTITENSTITDKQSLNFKYLLADGTYSLVKVDVSKFLTESEFGDGLTISNTGVVSVLKDPNSGKVRIADTPAGVTEGSADDTGLVDVLSVSSSGVKVDNIQAAINYGVQNASADLSVSAQGDNYITAAVDANNNKKINVTADVQTLTATAGTPGVYGTDGSQTTAPVAGTLSGTADSLADGADIATKVKTYVDGAIAIESARSDAKNVADLKAAVEALDGAATATAADASGDFSVLTKVNEIDGVVQSVGSGQNDSKEVLLKKVAATGAAVDVSYDNSTAQMTDSPTTVQAAIDKLDSRIDALGTDALESVTSTNAGIAVGTKSNHSQTLTLTLDNSTVGTGSELTGTHNALTITDNGLFLSNVWDCGTY